MSSTHKQPLRYKSKAARKDIGINTEISTIADLKPSLTQRIKAKIHNALDYIGQERRDLEMYCQSVRKRIQRKHRSGELVGLYGEECVEGVSKLMGGCGNTRSAVS